MHDIDLQTIEDAFPGMIVNLEDGIIYISDPETLETKTESLDAFIKRVIDTEQDAAEDEVIDL